MPKKSRTRRIFTDDFKKRVVAEAHQSGTSWSQVARHYDLNTNLLHRWKREFGEEAVFLPVELDGSSAAPAISTDADEIVDYAEQAIGNDVAVAEMPLEIILPCGTQLRCGQATDPEVLSVALTVLGRAG